MPGIADRTALEKALLLGNMSTMTLRRQTAALMRGGTKRGVRSSFREVFGHFEEIYRRLERLEQEYYAISQQLRRIEAALTDESGRREILERDLAALKEHVGLLQARIGEIERRLGA